MKNYNRLILILGVMAMRVVAIAQTVPPESNVPVIPITQPSQSVAYPQMYDISGVSRFNFIRTQYPDIPVANLPAGSFQYRQSTEYYDGLGRLVQTVAKKAVDGLDVVEHHVYDEFGRETYKYLPFTVPSTQSDGKIKLSPEVRLRNFYDAAGPDEHPFSRTEFEKAQIERVLKVSQPGRSWVGSQRGVSTKIRFNSAAEGIRKWEIEDLNTAIPSSSNVYSALDLTVKEISDEDGNLILEYIDKTGNLILRKEKIEDGNSVTHHGFACTYYVYDDLQRLRFVITPKAVQGMDGLWKVDDYLEVCYVYFYDKRGRLVEKKIPGKEVEFFVFDKRDRVILSQDGNLRQSGSRWLATYYDALDRPVMTALINASENRSQMVDLIDDGSVWSAPHWLAFFKNYQQFHQYPASITNTEILSYTYYDDYSELTGANLPYDQNQFDGHTPSSAEPFIAYPLLTLAVRGKVTGHKAKVIDPTNPGSSNWLTTVNYYDEMGRLIQAKSNNLKGGVDVISNIYYFQGMLYKTITGHSNPSALVVPGAMDAPLNNVRLVKTIQRDIRLNGGSDRPLKVFQTINTGPIFNIVNYDYDHLGRTTIKDLRAGLVKFDYNIRGFLSKIDAENHGQVPFKPIFEENIYYDKGFASQLYNGNIAGITWSGMEGKLNAYGYSYDKINRLIHAEYTELDNSGEWKNVSKNMSTGNITYDLNGNLLSMNQWGSDPSVASIPFEIDQLSYTYAPNTNKLIQVEDGSPSVPALPDFDNLDTDSEEYLYDPNGNLVKDLNKKISSIEYNHLNTPLSITVPDKGTIYYVYDAFGNRLQKKINDGTTTVVYDYIGSFVYKDNVLQYILNEEGRARPIANLETGYNTRFVYDYFIKDHLGNIRSTVTATPINSTYFARHEIATANLEQLVFDNIPNVRDSKPGSIDPNDGMAAHLVASDPDMRIGTAMMLRVMPGDKFSISAKSHYDGVYNGGEVSGTEGVIESLMSALMGGSTYAGVPISELPENIRTIKLALENPELASQLENILSQNDESDRPKAHLNYIFFDDNMHIVPELSGAIQVPLGGNNGWQVVENTNICNCTLSHTGTPGFVLFYVDNQSIGKDVWFDDIHIEHYESEVLEEDHYYPFGLTVQTAGNPSKQPYKYQGIELEKSFDIELYETPNRGLDPQIGRFTQIDPYAHKFPSLSPYSSMGNNPTIFVDPNGTENTVYMVNLQSSGMTEKQFDQLASELNQTVKDLGLNITFVAYKGAQSEFNINELANSDAAVVYGNANDVSNYIQNQLGYSFFYSSDDWGASNHPGGTIGNVSGISVPGARIGAKAENADFLTKMVFSTLHEVGHIGKTSYGTVSKPHSHRSQTEEGSALLWGGHVIQGKIHGGDYTANDRLERVTIDARFKGLKDFLKKEYNANFINSMKKYFDSDYSKDNRLNRRFYPGLSSEIYKRL